MEPMECINLAAGRFDDSGGVYAQKMMAVCVDKTEETIVEACIACAKEEGITDLYLLDRQFVIDALREKAAREAMKEKNGAGNHLVLGEALLRIRERISCPQLGDDHYGEWGALRWDLRKIIADLIYTVEFLDEAVRQYTDPGEAQCTEYRSSGNKFLDIIGCQQAEIAKLREIKTKYKRVYALLSDLLIIPNVDCAGKFRPIKNTSRHQVYRTVLDAQIILGMNRQHHARTDPGEHGGL